MLRNRIEEAVARHSESFELWVTAASLPLISQIDGMADIRDLKSLEINSRKGSTPLSGTYY